MKRNLLILSLCGIAALNYNMISATIGDIIGSAVDTAGDVVDAAVVPVNHTQTVHVVHPAVVVTEPVMQEPVLVTETVTTEPAIIDGEPAVLKTTVIEETAPLEDGSNVASGTVEYVERDGWLSRVWRSIFG